MFNPDTAAVSAYAPSFETAARSLKVEPIIAPVNSEREIETAIVSLGREAGGGLLIVVCLLPKLVAATTPLQLPFAGPFLLLVACVTLDVTAQARAFATSAALPRL